MSNTDYVIVGKIGSPYGIKGWLKILSYTEWTDAILEYKPWYLGVEDNWETVQLEEGREHGKGIIVKLAGYDTPEQSRQLTGKLIAVKSSQLPALKKDEYYWRDLEGLTVINQHGVTLGKVSYLLATGSNDVIVVKGDKEHAIPYLPGDVIKNIDLQNRIMYIDWEI